MTTALSNNLNELDILLQDLSAARYSGHVERKETFTESRVYSSQTTQYQDESIVPPRPPERSKSKVVGKFLDGPDPHTELHAVERSRTEKSSTVVTDNGNEESKWEYMGFGIWENREGSTSPNFTGRGYNDNNGYPDTLDRSGYPDTLDRSGYPDTLDKSGYQDTLNRSGYQDTLNRSGYQDTLERSGNQDTLDRSGNQDTLDRSGYQEKPGYQSPVYQSPYLEKTTSRYEKTIVTERNGGYKGEERTSVYKEEDRNSGYQVEERNSGYQVETVGASNATQELDDLMTSLNNFKMSDRHVDEPVIPPNLDTMLGNLQEDMNKQGVKTTQKGVCGACKKPIVGQVITALGYTWHPEHFTCSHCNQELGTSNFFERDGKPFCEQDYHHLFSPRCGYCSGPILDKCISALDNTWHPEHFLCSGCGTHLGEEGFHEREDSAYCKDCYFDQFAPKCGGCNTPITENYISSLNQQWHPNCFVCKECNSPFHDGAFFEHEGHPYCETHYHALRGSLCAGCHKPISGRCITAMFRKFHPEHFVCSFCLKQLNKGTFKEQGDKPYCHECFDRLFG